MNCADAAERITALVDGELPPGEREALERHLAGCAACREARAAEEAVAARVRALGRPPLPDGFRESVLDRIRAEPAAAPRAPAGRLLPMGPWLAAGAAAAAAALAMVYFGSPDRAGGPPVALRAAPAAEDGDAGARLVAAADARAPADPAAGRGLDSAAAEESGDRGPEDRSAPAGAARGDDAPEPVPEPSPAPAAPPVATPVPGAEKKTPDPGPPAKRAERERKPGADEDKDAPGEAGPRLKAEREREDAEGREVPRVALLYRAPGSAAAEQEVDRALSLHREIALETVGWKDAAELDSPYGRVFRELAGRRAEDVPAEGRGGGAGGAGFAVPAPRDRVLQVRIRARDLERLREAIAKSEALREAGTLVLTGLDGRALEDSARRALEEWATPGAEARAGGTKTKAPPAPDGGGGTPTPAPASGPAPGEPVPPPRPSQEVVEKIGRGTDPVRDGLAAGAAKSDASSELWVEVHLLGEPSPR